MRLLLILLCLGTTCFAQSADLIPREKFFSENINFQFQLDPDGENLYYRNREHPNTIFKKHIGSSLVTEKSYDGKVTDYRATSNGLLTIWSDTLIHLSLGDKEIELDKVAKSLKFIAHPNSRERHAVEFRDADGSDDALLTIDLAKGEVTGAKRLPPYRKYIIDADFNFVAASWSNGSSESFIEYNRNGTWTQLAKQEAGVDRFLGGFSQVISASADGNKFWYTSNSESDKTQLYEFDRSAEKSKLLAKADECDIIPFATAIARDGSIKSVVGLYAKTIRKTIDPKWKEDLDLIQSKMDGDLGFVQSVDDDNVWLLREFNGGPQKIFMFDRSTKKLDYLLTSYPDVKHEAMARRQAFSVPTRDGIELPVHVYLPNGSDDNKDGIPNEPLPTVMYVHGGPWVGIVHWNQDFHWRQYQLLANRGYAVIVCEFRGASGLGKDFVNRSVKTWGTDMTNDKTDIANWAVDKGISAKDKVGIWGWSYGGYATMAGLTLSPETYACGVSMYGISDLVSFGKTDFANNDFWKSMVGDAFDDEEAKMLAKHSPINFVDKVRAPMLMTTGSLDARVPQQQMDSMADSLNNAGKEVIYFYYPNEGHDYRAPESWISFWAVTEHFLSDNLGGKALEVGGDFELGDHKVVYGEEYIEKLN